MRLPHWIAKLLGMMEKATNEKKKHFRLAALLFFIAALLFFLTTMLRPTLMQAIAGTTCLIAGVVCYRASTASA